jgi:hypothetical protein
MSIYVHTVLKSGAVKAVIDGEVKKIFPVKWHGKDIMINGFGEPKMVGTSKYNQFFSEHLSEIAERSWKGERPEYIIDTGAHYDGKLHWDDPDHAKGFDVFKSSSICFLEDGGFKERVGRLVKVGRGKYEVIRGESCYDK